MNFVVLQRFYHQQSQLRDKMDNRRTKQTIDPTNPFLSHIPKYQHQYSSSPPPQMPANTTTYNPQTTQSSTQQPQSLPDTINKIDNRYNSPSPNILSNNFEPNYTSNIPIYHNSQNHHHPTTVASGAATTITSATAKHCPKSPFNFTNSNNRKISSASPPPPNVYIERGSNSSGYGNQNVYSNNLYGRTMTQHHQKQQFLQQCSKEEIDLINGSTTSGSRDTSREDQGK